MRCRHRDHSALLEIPAEGGVAAVIEGVVKGKDVHPDLGQVGAHRECLKRRSRPDHADAVRSRKRGAVVERAAEHEGDDRAHRLDIETEHDRHLGGIELQLQVVEAIGGLVVIAGAATRLARGRLGVRMIEIVDLYAGRPGWPVVRRHGAADTVTPGEQQAGRIDVVDVEVHVAGQHHRGDAVAGGVDRCGASALLDDEGARRLGRRHAFGDGVLEDAAIALEADVLAGGVETAGHLDPVTDIEAIEVLEEEQAAGIRL
ncbi:MAG: hypothetical protein ACYTA3_06090 [Planctomycetota bacterium]